MADLRAVAGLALAGTAAWALWTFYRRQTPGTAPTPATGQNSGPSGPTSSGASLAALFARLESGGSLVARNPRSTASGKYQFTRATWTRLGGAWGSDPTAPFGGLQPSEAEQDARFRQLLAGNAGGLQRAGLVPDLANLYGAHILGLQGFLRVASAPGAADLGAVVGSAVMRANPAWRGFTVMDFRRWLNIKVG